MKLTTTIRKYLVSLLLKTSFLIRELAVKIGGKDYEKWRKEEVKKLMTELFGERKKST